MRLPVLTLILVLASPLTSAYAARQHTALYRVRAGENLWVIAKRHSMTPEQLASLNRISVNSALQIGRAIRVPARANQGPRAPARRAAALPSAWQPAPAASPVTGATMHVVAAGDSLWKIARTYDTRPSEIASFNGLSVDAPLRPGQALKIPGHRPAVIAAQPVPGMPLPPAPAAPLPSQPSSGATVPVPAAKAPIAPAQADPRFEDGLAAGLPDQQPLLQAPAVVQPLPTTLPPAPAAPSILVATPKLERPLTPEERRRLTQIPSRGERWTTGLFAMATRYLGVRYRWGGTTPIAFDCSGFMQYVFARMGVSLPRTTFDMYAAGVPVPTVELRAGDLVFFETVSAGPSHAGIYLGDGRFIHASSGSGGVTIAAMSKSYYQARYLGARRF